MCEPARVNTIGVKDSGSLTRLKGWRQSLVLAPSDLSEGWSSAFMALSISSTTSRP